jgi:SAM-dependent methyltransferase
MAEPPPEAAASFSAGAAARAAGDARGAAAGFLTAFGLAPGVPAYRRAAFDVLNVMVGYRSLPAAVRTGLEAAARDPEIDLQPLSLVVRNLVEHDPRLDALARDDAGFADAAWLLDDPLLIAVLARAVNIAPRLEAALVRLRRHLCLAVAADKPTPLRDRYRAFGAALAAQCVANGHLWPESDDEARAVAALAARRDPDALLVRAAYRPLREIDAADAPRLPADLPTAWREDADVRARAAALIRMTPPASDFSAAMQAQYEAFPYPRWSHLDLPAASTLPALLARVAPDEDFAGLRVSADVLVAGCGTGRPALMLAATLPDATILAVDLSRTSLAYGQMRAAARGVANVRFAVADILALDGCGLRFDFIECGGVLHHMRDPAAGLRMLRSLLNPAGAMLVSLYSERGRRAEAAAQALVRERGFSDTLADLRAARAAILALPAGHPARGVIETPDFFSRDGLHDLIFNLHESRTTPAAMKRLLAECGLRTIAVDAAPALGGAAFRAAHPAPEAARDLDRWDEFEAAHPQVFAQMIRVWCRPA